ncbi:E3 ubiquitin-protein ligase RNF216 [Rhodotorula paludigena]|uniref:E3 ubiquitin-protein ligase RNF216 n=1 Tax=Rhodotorula paludigena TaxID=86838 RepID=UPI00317A1C71
MQPWQAAQVGQTAVPAQCRSPLALTSDDDLETPPSAYFAAARSLAPSSTRRDALRAWDRTQDTGRGMLRSCATDEETLASARVQAKRPLTRRLRLGAAAALGALIDALDDNLAPPPPVASTSGATGAGHKRPASPSRLNSPRPSSPSTPPALKRARTGRNGDVKGKGKAVVVLDSDDEDAQSELDDDDDLEVQPARDKGKRRATDVLVLDDEAPSSPAAELAAAVDDPLAQVLAVIPDCLPAHAATLLAAPQHANSAQSVVDALLSGEGGRYPRVGDAEREEQEKEREKKEYDWLDAQGRKRRGEVPSPLYKRIALDQLYTDFDLLPSALIKKTFLSADHTAFFAPTWHTLHTRQAAGDFASQQLKRARKPPKPVVRLVRRTEVDEETGEVRGEWDEEVEEEPPEELVREMQWLREKMLAERRARKLASDQERRAERERVRIERLDERARKRGEAIECGCCFDEVAVENTAQCGEGHLFCKTCAVANASDRIGRRQGVLPCMTADCIATFVPATYPSFLPPKMIESLAVLSQEKDLEQAFDGVEGFEKCPFCPYAVFIDNPDERLFRCERAECRKVSCRKCREEGHVPQTCEEAARDRRLPGVHAVAEAMTAALIRTCPGCKAPILKQDGCNKLTCECGVFSCFVCREKITGYDHFGKTRADGSSCPNFDDTDVRVYNEMEEARKRAQAELDPAAAEDAARLAAVAPVRGAPIYPAGRGPAAVAPAAAAAGHDPEDEAQGEPPNDVLPVVGGGAYGVWEHNWAAYQHGLAAYQHGMNAYQQGMNAYQQYIEQLRQAMRR